MSETLPRLSPERLAALPAGVARPRYDRAALRPRIVHLGLGAFFRAHGAHYTEDVLHASGGDWGVVGVSLQRPDQRDRLAPQGGLYTTLRRDASGDAARVVGCLLEVLVAPEDTAAVLARMAAPEAAIVSLTITEKGYCHDPASGRLNRDHPDIRHDLAAPEAPRSAVGFLVEALRLRRERGLRPFTVLCCDNLPQNGRLLAGLVHDFAAVRDPGLAAWIAAEVQLPCSMVDRIVPAMVPEDLEAAARATGCQDAAPVVHEPFRQWVIEDRFVDGLRPRWEEAGAQLVAEVEPFEHMKLRLLNGAHSALAYLGYLAGHETIVDTVSDPAFRAFVQRLWAEEIIPEVPPPPGVDLAAYAAALLDRFGNPAIRHRTWQIAMDGSQKLPQRLLGTLRERLAQGRPIPLLALIVAGWIRYVGGLDEQGQEIDVRDPLARELRAALDAAGTDPAARVRAALGFGAIFGDDLPRNGPFVQAVTTAYARLLRDGARASLAA
ncbi:mannitol dehydrogenase family protein [Roseomonas sp. M0104]|uniref:Mannitol dehydrogenase family protein n=1 Tax=Teichococcus coralli TaxID=2545983 RepID=A0A845BAP4_9PROT|nr:mannitol dehydrogenase family protein [Pseudoroseomonas coralli]MXP64241.1 mannitol dehydrogenase family protein [Pseudoroseomonas coralli]